MASTAPNHALDGESKKAEIISILSVCCFLSTALVILRVFTRSYVVRAFGPDDWTLVVAQVLALGAALTIFMEQHFGLGQHIWTIGDDMVPYLESFYASMLVYNAAIVTVKISIVLMYRRIFNVGKHMQRATLATLIFLCAWGVALVVTLSQVCIPARAFWEPENVPGGGKCMPLVPVFFVPAVINMITDFIIFLMPLPAIRQLQLPLKQKIILSLILCLGLFTCVISIVRLSTLDAAATSSDSTWDNTEAALWSYLELTIAIIAACLPTLRPFMGRYFPRFMAILGGNLSGNSGGTGGGNHGNAAGLSAGGHRTELATWGGTTGRDVHKSHGSVAKGSPSDSTDALYDADPEIALHELDTTTTTKEDMLDNSGPGRKPPRRGSRRGTETPGGNIVEGYRQHVERRQGKNETVIGVASPGSRESDGSSELLQYGTSPGEQYRYPAGIRATTVIKQEYNYQTG
ncbi:integral membrane protein [Diplogelasinospora grovesii]|uniref:Integral membrane protein n=1 Tax=Diplogelasinospora grovesii TaxID=303347 RepID=A0AAN6N0I8_9PEZI|nr:integral membrane protein [Diplogelasinospora grovesii]